VANQIASAITGLVLWCLIPL